MAEHLIVIARPKRREDEKKCEDMLEFIYDNIEELKQLIGGSIEVVIVRPSVLSRHDGFKKSFPGFKVSDIAALKTKEGKVCGIDDIIKAYKQNVSGNQQVEGVGGIEDALMRTFAERDDKGDYDGPLDNNHIEDIKRRAAERTPAPKDDEKVPMAQLPENVGETPTAAIAAAAPMRPGNILNGKPKMGGRPGARKGVKLPGTEYPDTKAGNQALILAKESANAPTPGI